MPAGVTWPTYLKFTCAALLSMFAGAQVVHTFYKPLEDMDSVVEAERKRFEEEKRKLDEAKEQKEVIS